MALIVNKGLIWWKGKYKADKPRLVARLASDTLYVEPVYDETRNGLALNMLLINKNFKYEYIVINYNGSVYSTTRKYFLSHSYGTYRKPGSDENFRTMRLELFGLNHAMAWEKDCKESKQLGLFAREGKC